MIVCSAAVAAFVLVAQAFSLYFSNKDTFG